MARRKTGGAGAAEGLAGLRLLETLGRDRWSATHLARDARGRRRIVREFAGEAPESLRAALPFLFRAQRAVRVPGLVVPESIQAGAGRVLWIHRPAAGEPLSRSAFRFEQALAYLDALAGLVGSLHGRALFGVELTAERLFVGRSGEPLLTGLVADPALWFAAGGLPALRLAQADPRVDLAALGGVIAAVLDRTRAAARDAHRIEELRRLGETLRAEEPADRPSLAVLRSALAPAPTPSRRRGGDRRAAARPLLVVPRMVGRELVTREVEALIERVVRAQPMSGRRPHLVALTGRAGVGKTRVLSFLAERARRQGIEVLATEAQAGDRRPFGPLHDLLAEAGAGSYGEAPGEAEEAVPLAPAADRRRRIESAARTLLATLRNRPALLLIEDVDLLSAPALEALSYLVRALALEEPDAARVALIVTLRPSDDPEHPAPAGRTIDELREEGFAERVRLPPLDAATLAELLASMEMDVAGLAERLAARTGGNPRFAEELLRAEHERSREAPAASIAEAFRRRLRRLTAEERRLLDAAAILGDPATLPLLAALVPVRDGGRLYANAIRLVGRRILRPLTGLGFAFANRDAAGWVRERISPHRARQLHRLAGRCIEAQGVRPDAGVLARHFELGGVRDRFLAYGRRAASDLEASHANERALELYAKLLELVPAGQTPLRIDLLERLAALRGLGGDFAGAVAAYQELIALPHDRGRTWQYYKALGEALRDREDYPAAAEAFDKGLATLAAGEDLAVADLLTEKAVIVARLGDSDTARGLAEMAGNLASGLPESREVAAVRNRVGATFHRLGDFDRMVNHIEAALRISERVGALDLAAIALNNLGLYLGQRGDLSRAIELCQRSHEIQEKLGDVEATAYTSVNLAALYLQTFDPEKAQHYVELGLRLASRFGKSFIVAGCLANLAEVHIQRGRYADALDNRLRAIRLMEKLGRRRDCADHLFGLCRLYALIGDTAETERSSRRLTQLAQERDEPRLQGLSNVAAASSLRLRREHDAARRLLLEAEATFRDIGAEELLVLCQLDLAELDLLGKDLRSALIHAEDAREIAARREFHPDRGLALLLIAEAVLLDDPQAAERSVREAEGIARELDQPELRWRCEALFGELALIKGDRAAAARRFELAREILDPLVDAVRDKDHAWSYMRDPRRLLLLRRARENPDG